MNAQPLSPERFAVLLERIERDEGPHDRSALAYDDAADVALAHTLFALRTRPDAPVPAAWHREVARESAVVAVPERPRQRQQRTVGVRGDRMDAGRSMHGRAELPRAASDPRRRAELALTASLLVASAGLSWLAMSAYESRFHGGPASGTPAALPAVAPTDRAAPAPGSSPTVVRHPSEAATTTVFEGAYPAPPSPSSPVPAPTATLAIEATASTTMPATQAIATRERAVDPMPVAPTEQSPYPAPSNLASSATPEPRVTRIAPRPVPTAPPTPPSPAPSAVPWPTERPLPPTPTAPNRPTETATPDPEVTPGTDWSR